MARPPSSSGSRIDNTARLYESPITRDARLREIKRTIRKRIVLKFATMSTRTDATRTRRTNHTRESHSRLDMVSVTIINLVLAGTSGPRVRSPSHRIVDRRAPLRIAQVAADSCIVGDEVLARLSRDSGKSRRGASRNSPARQLHFASRLQRVEAARRTARSGIRKVTCCARRRGMRGEQCAHV